MSNVNVKKSVRKAEAELISKFHLNGYTIHKKKMFLAENLIVHLFDDRFDSHAFVVTEKRVYCVSRDSSELGTQPTLNFFAYS